MRGNCGDSGWCMSVEIVFMGSYLVLFIVGSCFCIPVLKYIPMTADFLVHPYNVRRGKNVLISPLGQILGIRFIEGLGRNNFGTNEWLGLRRKMIVKKRILG